MIGAATTRTEPAPPSLLRPRDIQARIRAGQTPEEVAAAAQIPVTKVMVFATPVIAERAYVAQQALLASVRRRSADGPVAHLGQAVAQRLGEDAEVSWDAWRREDGRWTLVAETSRDGEPVRATFGYDTAGRYVVAEDDAARALIGERARLTDDSPGVASQASQAMQSVQSVPARQLSLGDDAIALVTGRSPAAEPEPVSAGPSEAEEATEDLTTAAAALRAVPLTSSPEVAPAPETEPAADAPDTLFETPAPPAPARPAKSRGRAAVPSWDEIMFGSSRPT